MNIKLLSELVLKNRIENSVLYSYFLVFEDQDKSKELLPIDNHSAAFPLKIDNYGKILSGEINFFNRPFYNGLGKEELNPFNDIEFFDFNPTRKKCIIINLLDNCFGHSLLKMFNIVLFYQKYSDDFDLYVITPPSLSAYLPKNVINGCCINKSYTEFEKGYSLQNVLDKIKSQYVHFEYAFLNTYHDYSSKEEVINFFSFVKVKTPVYKRENIIFYYRSDKNRRWGILSQRRNIVNLFDYLRPFFNNVNFIILGEKDNVVFPGFIQDRRCDNYNLEIETQYNSLLMQSVLVIGIHGSHMILPSLFAKLVFHIVPKTKIKNCGEDVFNLKTNVIESANSSVNIIVNNALFYPGGRSVAGLVLVNLLASLEKIYKASIGNEDIFDQESYLVKEAPFISYRKAKNWWDKKESHALKIQRLIRR